MHYPLANTNDLVYFFQIRKLMEKPIERYTSTYLSCWEGPPKCTCLDLPASFYKNTLRSCYILRGALCGAALLLTPWGTKCGAIGLSQGTQEKKFMLVWVSLQGQDSDLSVGGWGWAQAVSGFLLYFLRVPPLCCAQVAVYLQMEWDYTHVPYVRLCDECRLFVFIPIRESVYCPLTATFHTAFYASIQHVLLKKNSLNEEKILPLWESNLKQ